MKLLHRYLQTAVITAAATLLLSFTVLAAEPGSDVVSDTSGGLITASDEAEQRDAVTGPGTGGQESSEKTDTETDSTGTYKKGESVGLFTTTGYCNCSKCSGGHNLTYSGTVPQAQHTISADLNLFPIGTKLWIDGVVYTVEDKGTSVKGNWIDIFYDNHSDALDHGMKTQEVYRAVEV